MDGPLRPGPGGGGGQRWLLASKNTRGPGVWVLPGDRPRWRTVVGRLPSADGSGGTAILFAGYIQIQVLAAPLFYSQAIDRSRRVAPSRVAWARRGHVARVHVTDTGWGTKPGIIGAAIRDHPVLCPAYPSRLKLAHASVAALAITVAMLCISVSRRERGFNANTHGRTDRTGRWCLLASRL
jgi:hypothetical protein